MNGLMDCGYVAMMGSGLTMVEPLGFLLILVLLLLVPQSIK